MKLKKFRHLQRNGKARCSCSRRAIVIIRGKPMCARCWDEIIKRKKFQPENLKGELKNE